MKKTRRWLIVPLLAVLGYLGFRWIGEGGLDSARDEPPGMLLNRLWLEKVPESPTEYIQGSYVMSTPEVGIFQRASAFDYHLELFRYDLSAGKLKLTFPQSDKSFKITFTIKGCDDLPPFDLCLTLSENPWGGPKKYYGFRDSGDESKALPGVREAWSSRASSLAH
jgi:hypothetical protein